MKMGIKVREIHVIVLIIGALAAAIYGDIVVWNYHRNIYGYNLKTRKEFQITTGPHRCRKPAISKDIVVWEDSGHDGYFIFGYNLSTHEEFKLTGTLTLFTAFSQHDPALYDNIVVWTEGFYDNIYGYNLSTSDSFAIATAHMSKCSFGAAQPAIHEDIVVWTDCRNGNPDIYGFNLLTEQEFLITTNESCQSSPAIHGDIVVWEDDRNGNYDIYGADISPPLTTTRFNSRTRIILSDSFLVLLVASAVAVPSFLIGRGAWQMKKMKETSQMLPSSDLKDFRRNLMTTHLSSVLLLSYAVFAVYAYLLEMRMLSGLIFFILPVFSVLNYFWSKRIPYLRITNDEIMIFKTMGRKPKVVRRDTIRKINIQTWPDLPYKADLLLSNNKKVEIEFSSIVEEDRKDLIQALRGVVG
ncbi:MAG: hypothetical protein HXS48_03920 [Theionarchaea archaeon]|nr:MAG: hypothetical protein AYK19_03555 [Theionarchaea archaeon DG-70-1]MBU7026067.1 hypothetical protein [Theionarchaea archaeon]